MEERFETFTVLINRINRNIRKIKNKEMAEYNLRSAHISCLYFLYSSPCVTATQLCERCEEDKATISRALEYLEENGYLESNNTKRYKTPLLLTNKGKSVAKKIAQKIDGVLEQVGQSLTEEERLLFYQNLIKISNQLEEITNRLS